MGAVDSLIVWENLSVTRYVLRSNSSDGRSIFMHFVDLPSLCELLIVKVHSPE